MNKVETSRSRFKRCILAAGLGAVLLWTAAPARAFELGVINSYQYYTDPEKVDVGLVLMGRQEIFHYFDVGGRVGVMWSDALEVTYFPMRITGAVKLPLCDGRFVPFAGFIAGYDMFPEKYRQGEWLGPNAGFDWRFGENNRWSVFFEVMYNFKDHLHLRDSSNAEVQRGGGPGTSIGLSYRF